MNYYVLLGVSRSAHVDTIRSAFRGLVRRYHPDAGEGSSPQKLREIVEAYETLNDPARRRRYDETLESRPSFAGEQAEPVWRARAPEPLIPERRTRSRATFIRPVRSVPSSPLDAFEELFQILDQSLWFRF
jgi:curved DNA-binding protein CbpA